jgi:hypothetical protein
MNPLDLIIRVLLTIVVAAFGYILWYWFASDGATICLATMEDGDTACMLSTWSTPTIGGARAIASALAGLLVLLIWTARD